MPKVNTTGADATFLASRLKMRHFALLVAIADCGTLLKAAERVAISQPGATKALQEIEKAFGQQLFERTYRGLEPSDVGLCAIRYARLICTDLTNLGSEIDEIGKGSGGRLSIGSVMGAVPLAARLISDLVSGVPNLKVQFTEGTSLDLLKMLDEGRLDFVLGRISVSEQPENYEAHEVWKERISVIANRSHPLAGKSRISLADLDGYPWIVCLPDMPMRRHFEREFANCSVPEPRTLIETASALSVLRLMKQNQHLCSMQADDVVEEFIGSNEICRLDVSLTSTSEPYYLVYRKDRELSSNAHLAISQLMQIAAKNVRLPPAHPLGMSVSEKETSFRSQSGA